MTCFYAKIFDITKIIRQFFYKGRPHRTVQSGRSTVDGVWWTVLVAGVGKFMWTYTLSSILLRIITVNIEGVTQIMK